MKKIFLVFFLCIIGKANAQSFTDGIFTTTFGNISWTTETGYDYPNGGFVYGDYRNNGTFIGKIENNGKEIDGSFFNGSSEGKFIFMSPFGTNSFFDQGIKTFAGNWGYTSNNKYSQNPEHEWKITGKIAQKDEIKNVTNVWSGKWNTTDGAMYLMQTRNKITGTYKGVGTVDATYNPSSRTLKGTFKNTKINKIGYIEFYFEGNTFKGKWGWNASMTEGNWDGTKHVKNNKELSKMAVSTPPTTSTPSSATTKYIIKAISIGTTHNDVYGFFGCKLYKVTQSGRVLVNSFGNKSADFYNTTENNTNKLLSKNKVFPNTPEFLREYIISNADLNNSQIKFELELYSHLKAKTVGTNINYGYKKEILRLDQIKLGETIKVDTAADGATIFGAGYCVLNFKVTKN